MIDVLQLLWGTLCLRPYVFIFLAVYLVAGVCHLGWRVTSAFIPLGYAVAWLSEYASIHLGIPYGDYFYIPATVHEELWVAGVPFMDSLSYVFLSYCSYATALFLLSPLRFLGATPVVLETHRLRKSSLVLVFSAILFTFLDVIIDPVALRGERWFLGQIYGYRHEGVYFGVPLSNFAGWLVVGLALVALLQQLASTTALRPGRLPLSWRYPLVRMLGPVLYGSILAFNLSVTFWIGEVLLATVGVFLVGLFVLMGSVWTVYKVEHLPEHAIICHLEDFPGSCAAVARDSRG
ncbi:MAG: carotenoid biosynthesis protein [Bacteroidetes bacterium]|nr:MAG: carotenoid biosynthesis protein [Bacteroidota bacterium]